MNVLNHFSIPYKGMGNGIHNLEFDIDNTFFSAFEDSHINNGKFKVFVELDKRSDHSVLTFDVDGYTNTNCDRCLESIDLPMYGEYTLHIKHRQDGESNDEIVFIHPETSILNIAQYVYEFILLSMPIIKAYDCDLDETPPCNFEVLNKLNESNLDKKPSLEETNSVWSSLKDLKLDN